MPDPTPAEIERGHQIVSDNSRGVMRCPHCGSTHFGGDGQTNTCHGDDGCGRTTPYNDWLTDEIEGYGETMAAAIGQALADERERLTAKADEVVGILKRNALDTNNDIAIAAAKGGEVVANALRRAQE